MQHQQNAKPKPQSLHPKPSYRPGLGFRGPRTRFFFNNLNPDYKTPYLFKTKCLEGPVAGDQNV